MLMIFVMAQFFLNDAITGRDKALERLKKINKEFEDNLSVLSGQTLHAKSLGFIHPTKNKFINFESELPNDFKKILELLEKLSS